MSLDAAKKWFEQHPHEIPAVRANLSEIHALLDQERQGTNVVKYAVRDPGLTLSILKKINANRGRNTGLDVVESPQSAISMLGNQVTKTLFRGFPIAEEMIKDPDQVFLFQQIINRSTHNRYQAELWGKENGFRQLEKLMLAALLAYSGELLCCLYDYENYKEYALANSSSQQEERIFGFYFPELTEAVCETLNLPDLISMLQPHTENVSQSSNLLHFTTLLCKRCEQGWNDEKVLLSMQKYSEYFQIPLEKVIFKTHQFSVLAARDSFMPEAWQPASRLILTKDEVWKPRASRENQKVADTVAKAEPSKTATQSKAKPQSAIESIKILANKANVSQSEILTTCVRGVFNDIKMGRVALLLFSKDKTQLVNRMSLGIEDDAPLKKYQVQIDRSGLFQILLKKPSAVWVNPGSIKKYQHLLPETLLAQIHTDNFFTMSLFIGSKPVGIIYADRTNSTAPMDEAAFHQFKQLITLTSKALTLIINKQQSK